MHYITKNTTVVPFRVSIIIGIFQNNMFGTLENVSESPSYREEIIIFNPNCYDLKEKGSQLFYQTCFTQT